MTDYIVTSGQTSSSLTLNAGDTLIVQSGGTLINLVVSSGATDTVQSGGNVSQVLVEGSQTLAGGTATSETVVSGGVESVLAGGNVYSAGIWSGGAQTVFSGGQAEDLLSSGGTVTLRGGYAAVTLLGGEFDVDGGTGRSLGAGTVSSGGLEVVSGSGAQTADSGVFAGGRELVLAGGSATTIVGGVLIVSGASAGGYDYGTVSVTDGQYYGNVDQSGTVILSSGGIDGGGQIAGTVIVLASGLLTVEPNNGQNLNLAAGHVIVSSGGRALNEKFEGGTITVSSGGTVTGTHLAFGATMLVDSGGSASGTILISGAEAIVASGGTVSNTAVDGGGLLIVLPGAVQSGTVSSGGGVAVSAGVTFLHSRTFVSSATTVSNVQVGSADLAVVLSGGQVTGATVSGSGEILAGGGGVVSGAMVSGGSLELIAGGIADGTVVGSGGALLISGGVASGTELLGHGFLDLGLLPFSAGETASFDSATSTLGLFGAASSGAPLLYSQVLSGDYTSDTFTVSGYFGNTATSIEVVPCFTPGTAILTDEGERPVESLAIGDRVITHRGAAEPIIWIGRRSYAGRFLLGRRHLQPVTIQAGALDGQLPRQDLVLSPMHALFIDGVLVPAGLLVNGATITQSARCERVDYLHIELAEHGVVFAQGALAETFLDDDSRGMFHNAQEYAARYPGVARPTQSCAPRVEHGYALEAIRRRLTQLAA